MLVKLYRPRPTFSVLLISKRLVGRQNFVQGSVSLQLLEILYDTRYDHRTGQCKNDNSS